MANRLGRESSPYLLLHADNPVDWYPWGEEAFEKRPRGGQADLPLGRLLDLLLVPRHGARVLLGPRDRARSSTRASSRQGRPRGAARPRRDLHGRDAAPHALRRLAELGVPDARPQAVLRGHVLPAAGRARAGPASRACCRACARRGCSGAPSCWSRPRWSPRRCSSSSRRRARRGPRCPAPSSRRRRRRRSHRASTRSGAASARAPKFPSPANLFFLLERARCRRTRRARCWSSTLDAHGPRRPHGPARRRLPPLLDRRSLARAALREDALRQRGAGAALRRGGAARARKRASSAWRGSRCDFVLRELTGAEGGFLSAIDAETDGHEGAYYTWTAAELDAVLAGAEDALLRAVLRASTGAPNFEADRYVLLPAARRYAEQARSAGTSEAELLTRLEPGPARAARGARRAQAPARGRQGAGRLERPDDRRAGARGSAAARAALPRPPPARRELRARAACVDARVGDAAARLARRARRSVPAFLDDYAFLVEGLLALARRDAGSRAGSTRRCGSQEEQEQRLGDPDGRLLRGRRGPAAAGARQAGLRRRGRVGQRRRGARTPWRSPGEPATPSTASEPRRRCARSRPAWRRRPSLT